MNRILTKGFWNEQKIILKGFGRGRVTGGVSPLRPIPEVPGIPVNLQVRLNIDNPVEFDKQTNFEVFNPVEKNEILKYPMFSPLLKVNDFYFDIDLSVAINKQMRIPIEQRLSYDKLIRILKAI